MARKASHAQDDPKVETSAGAETEAPEAPEEQALEAPEEKAPEAPKEQPPERAATELLTPKDAPRTAGGMVEAKLKVRWASGGRPHEAGDTVPMTRGTYERLKKYGRVE